MSLLAATAPARKATPSFDEAHEPVLAWLIFAGVNVFAGVALWRYGLVRVMVTADRTYISSIIAVVYLIASVHCLIRAIAISRETQSLLLIEAGEAAPGRARLIADHLSDLAAKARARGAGRLDQTLLLRALAERLAAPNKLGGLAADIVIKLGLIGTIVGFILMLGPVAGLDADDDAALKLAMATMSAGMGVAMYSTLAGLIGAILIKAQYLIVETATTRTFWRAVRYSETSVVPSLEGPHV